MRIALTLVVLLTLIAVADAREAVPLEVARRLEKEGQTAEAFRAYLHIDHAEHQAIRIARFDPERYLAILSDAPAEVPTWRVRLLMADLEFALGERAKALGGYRSVAIDLADSEYDFIYAERQQLIINRRQPRLRQACKQPECDRPAHR